MDLDLLAKDIQKEFGASLSPGIHMLVSEVGKLMKEVTRATQYGTAPLVVTDSFKEELGDVLVDLLLLAQDSQVSLEECLNLTLQKMRQRLQEKGHVGSGS